MFSAAQQVNFNQVRLAFEQLLLFGQVELASGAANRLIAGTEHFDHSNHPALICHRQNLDEHLPHLHRMISDDPGRVADHHRHASLPSWWSSGWVF
jgi:hypothetical protein